MGFFERNRAELTQRGIDPDRLPPGQYHTDRFPVLHAGSVPAVDLGTWEFSVDGLVLNPKRWTWREFERLPRVRTVVDIHCVTKWSKFDTEWEGVSVAWIWEQLDPNPAATHVLVRDIQGYTANLPIADFIRPQNLFAHSYGGEPLDPDHGYPLRLVVPHLYFWKSVKWVAGFTVLDHEEPGFWEQNGYHIYGDPFREQRFSGG